MGSDRMRVLVLALASLGLIVAATLVLDWFGFDIPASGIDRLAIDLRSAHGCAPSGVCVTVPMPRGGMYPTIATATFWGSLLLAAVIALQAGSRIVTEGASHGISKAGYLLGCICFVLALGAGYFFGPDTGSMDVGPMGISISINRTWAPLALMLGDALGIATLYYAVTYSETPTAIEPVVLAPARALVQPTVAAPRVKTASIPTPPPVERPSWPAITAPEGLRGKLKFATLTAEVTRAGVDARREDGATILVMWRDVVGVVARRLPPTYDGATFVDLVSAAGSTLRILPWTRLSGDAIAGEGEQRARAFVELVVARCPEAKLDAATRTFVDAQSEAAQLPDIDTLAAHDERLA